jgi:alpha-mannosidase
MVEGLVLRNELFELTVSHSTGGIQSLKTHRDRSTRVSQRLVFHEAHGPDWRRSHADSDPPALDTQMIAERVEVSQNDTLVGEITSHGRLLDTSSELLARFTQKVRTARGLPAVIVDVELLPERLPHGDIWRSYFGSRLAWKDETLSMRRGHEWRARHAIRQCIESPEWVELSDGVETITCFACGLPFHRRAADTWLDTLLVVAGEERRRFQFALALDEPQPAKAALVLQTCCAPPLAALPSAPSAPQGWLLHVGAKNVLITHIEPLGVEDISGADHFRVGGVSDAAPAAPCGLRLRLLETEGRETQSSVAAFRSLAHARITDFRGNQAAVLSVADGRAQFDIGPYCWIQIEAEW